MLRIRTTPEVKNAVERLAAAQCRSAAAQVGMVLRDVVTAGSSQC